MHPLPRLLPLGLVLAAAGSAALAAPPALTAARLGGEADPALLTREDEALVLRGGGREAYMGTDEGSFAYLRTEAPNFTFTARIAKAPSGTPNPKYGLSVRTGHAGPDRCLALRYDGYEGNRCIQWFLRHHWAPTAHDGGRRSFLDGLERAMTATEGFWMRLQRRYPEVRLFTSPDGQAWHEVGGGTYFALLAQDVLVGLQVTAGGDGRRPVEVAFDHVDFTTQPPADGQLARRSFREYHPQPPPWQMHLIQATAGRGEGRPAAAFLLKPKAMDPRDIRAILLTAGSKEVMADGQKVEWDSKDGALRKPKAMDRWQGVWEIEGMRLFEQGLAHHGLARVGGVFHAWRYPRVVEELAAFTGIAHLPNLPVVITGDSFAGGHTAQAAHAMPERTVAAAPMIIGMAGAQKATPKSLLVPHMHIYGSRDGGHLAQATKWTPVLRRQHARWANAPMWWVAHRHYKANALIYPFFLEMLRVRIPADAQPTKRPVELLTLAEEDGWLGLVETWETNFPRAVPFAEAPDAANAVWLPTEKTARLWQAFVSYNPRTVIRFPTFDGGDDFGHANPPPWHNSVLEARKPFRFLAIGPKGEDVTIEVYAGLRKLERLEGSPHCALLEGLAPGLHALYAITTVGEEREISRPVLVLCLEKP